MVLVIQKRALRVHQFDFVGEDSELTIVDLESKAVIGKAWLIIDSQINFPKK